VLPPRGSAQDLLLEELHRRKRAERFTAVTLFARILGGGLGVHSEALEAMLNAYSAELTQNTYTPEYAATQRQRRKTAAQQKTRNKLSDDALMKKLEGLTAPDEATPSKKGGTRRR